MTSKKPTFEGTPYEGKTDGQVKNALYNLAMQQIRDNHMDEFVQIVENLYDAHGLSYRRRLTEQEKAEQQITALLAANPGLASKFTVVDMTDDGV